MSERLRGSICFTARNGLVAAVAMAVSMQASAQLEEVVVTAQKRSESMQDVPIAMAAFTSESMQDMGITSSQDLQVAVPALVFPSLGSLGQVYLRGVGTRFTLNGLDPSVATYVGERYSPRGSGAIFSLGPDVDRVEVLKGPQGVLFGRNATGGAIRVIKKDVTDVLEGEFQASVGNYDYYKVGGTVNIPISDTLGIRLSGQTEKRDGLRKNIAAGQMTYLGPIPDRHDELDRTQFNAHLAWTPTDRLSANLYVDYWTQDELQGSTYVLGPPELNRGILFGGLVEGLSHDTTSTDAIQPNDGDQIASELNLRYSFDSVDLVSVTTYADFDTRWNSEGDGSSAQIFDPASAFDASKTYSQELRLESTGDGPFSWTLGGFYYDDEHSQEFIFWTNDFAVLNEASQGDQTVDTTSWAAFGHVRWDMTERLAVTAGVRYSYDERDVVMQETSRTQFANRTLAAPILPFSYKGDWSETTPQFTVEYNFDETMVYATYSSGYKSGGVNYPIYSTPEGIEPEMLDMFEIGMKGDYLDNTLRLNASLFYYDYTDLQVQRPASSGAGTTVENAADAEITGLDLDATWAPTADFTLRVGLSALDSEYSDYTAIVQFSRAVLDGTINTDNPTPGAAGQEVDVSGRSLLKAPELSYFATVNYDFHLGSGVIPVSLTYSYKDDTIFDFGDDPVFGPYLTQDGYGLLSGRISYEPAEGNWSVGVWGRNLTDEEYLSEIAANAQGLRGAPAEPRTVGIDARYSF
ncbi:TonB-dependent receptor [Luminiphilus syltensis NOR5-1B]|uniref:TonB-dependent receptor n=1 Tax=Luminiphilus syltensis NOR5-1B TaxID=565045 RepID=B8KXN9_9GAMM|nr:TonB-dependent receptor [Luminiphilus syltensis]EED36692.1 TonB-dependent receptor [Luminiphilus syltensis NOR5-1B]